MSVVCTPNVVQIRRSSDPQLRNDFLEMQRRWLSLARSYEFSEQLEFLSAIERNKELPAQICRD